MSQMLKSVVSNYVIIAMLVVVGLGCVRLSGAIAVNSSPGFDSTEGEGRPSDREHTLVQVTHNIHQLSRDHLEAVSDAVPDQGQARGDGEDDELKFMSRSSDSDLDAELLLHVLEATNTTVCGLLVNMLAELQRIEAVCREAYQGTPIGQENSQSEEKRSWLDRGLANKVRLQKQANKRSTNQLIEGEVGASRSKRSWLDRSLLLVGRMKRSWLDRSLLDKLVDDLAKTRQVRNSRPPVAVKPIASSSENHVIEMTDLTGQKRQQGEPHVSGTGNPSSALHPSLDEPVGDFLLRLAALQKRCEA